MATCSYCGSDISFTAKFCPNCGAQVTEVPVEQTNPSAYKSVSYPSNSTYQPQPQQSYIPQPVPPVSTGGLLAWAIITLFLCTIPGIVALVKTANINKATTVAEQQARMSGAKTWCIIGTVLGILAIIGSVAGRSMY